MSEQISVNIRYLLWRKDVPPQEWAGWLASRTSLDPTVIGFLLSGYLADEQVSGDVLGEVARAFDHADGGESIRFSDLVADGCSVLTENLRFLFGSLGRGGKKAAAVQLGIDPTTVSRWLSGAYEPHLSALRQVVTLFGLPMGTDLRHDPVFLSADPVGEMQLRGWLHGRIDMLSSAELRELYPALRRMLGRR